MNTFDSTHFCKKCGYTAYRTLDETFWCPQCQELTVVISIPVQQKINTLLRLATIQI